MSELQAFGNVVPTGLAAWGRTLFVGLAGAVPHPPEEGKVLALAAGLLLPLPGILWRIRVEEAELGRVLGDVYSAYRARTTRLIPGLW